MNSYTASNGVHITERPDGTGYNFGPPGSFDLGVITGISPEQADALREFFRAEDDERLGRWRWRKDPDYIVYAERDGIYVVLRESTGEGTGRNGLYIHHMEGQAAHDYVASQKPKPWLDAKHGEVWVLTPDGGEEEPFRVLDSSDGPRFFPIEDGGDGMSYGRRTTGISDGRRIWPVSS